MTSDPMVPNPLTQTGTGPVDPGRHKINIAIYIILTLVTFGLFNIYWNFRQMESCNALLGRKEFRFWPWLLLCLITCGIYHFFYQYQMGAAIVEIQRKMERPPFDNLPVISVVVSVLGLMIVVDVIHQHEINKIVG